MYGRYRMFTPAFKKEFAPFAVESTGRIGKAAHQLLDTLAKSQICSPFLVNILKRDISLEMLKFRANLVISNRMKLQIAPSQSSIKKYSTSYCRTPFDCG